MEKFQLHILGCGSATPTVRHFPSAQVLTLRGKSYMVDCGEGAQLQLRRCRIGFASINHIFISHLHGDHCFGLMGLISTFALHGRPTDLHVYSPAGLREVLQPQIDYFCRGMSFQVVFHEVPTDRSEEVFSDSALRVTTIPLQHRVPTCGYLFCEQPGLPHIRRDMIDFLGIPHYAIMGIKEGGGWTTDDGRVFSYEQLTVPARPPRAYAYVSDTLFCPRCAELIRGVDLLFHESTFAESDAARAVETNHSTAMQAARMAELAGAARLVIGHFSSRYDDEDLLLAEARSVFPHTERAAETRVFDIGE